MRIIYWIISIIAVVCIWYSEAIHNFLSVHIIIYSFNNAGLIQVIFAVVAGIFATKASDSSRELKKLMKITEIKDLLEKADNFGVQSEEQKHRYENLVKIIKHETELQFAQNMLFNHREQLLYHWEHILAFEALFSKEDVEKEIDPETRKIIQAYLIRTRYFKYIGKNFLQNIPLIGGILDYLVGPLWDQYYLSNLHKINNIFTFNRKMEKKSMEDIKSC